MDKNIAGLFGIGLLLIGLLLFVLIKKWDPKVPSWFPPSSKHPEGIGIAFMFIGLMLVLYWLRNTLGEAYQ